jgi:tRNA U34 5-methylaminomethyl-2-thiouridine-forming methyltransferase MnmC
LRYNYIRFRLRIRDMINFFPVQTDDGTISLFNTEIGDIYHSKVGAYTESLNKFVIPSGILEYVKNNNEVKILDMCFGLGYNSKVAISEIWKINPECNINITGIEIDPYVLTFSTLIPVNSIDSRINEVFNKTISSVINTALFREVYFPDVNFTSLDFNELTSPTGKISSESFQQASLHNIYYRTISNRSTNIQKASYNSNILNIDIFICDARNTIVDLEPYYNYVFHDAFTPFKQPALWTVDLFKEYFRILDINGNITTYSSSAAIRSGLIEAGFAVGKTSPIGRKSSGTIAFKNKELLDTPLDTKEHNLLETTSGIPYRDSNFRHTTKEILELRKGEQILSGRLSTGKYLKTL